MAKDERFEKLKDELRRDEGIPHLIHSLAIAEKHEFMILVCKTPLQAEAAMEILSEDVSIASGNLISLHRFGPTDDDTRNKPLAFEDLVSLIIDPLTEWKKKEDLSHIFIVDASGASKEDEDAWTNIFRRLNEKRNELMDGLAGPLLLILTPALAIEFAFHAPELWGMRTNLVRTGAKFVRPPSDFDAFMQSESKALEKIDLDRLNTKIEEARQRYTADPDSFTAARALDILLSRLGEYEKERGSLERAQEIYEESLNVMRMITTRNPERTEWRYNLAASINNVGDVLKDRGDLNNALSHYQEGLEIMRQLLDLDPEQSECLRDVSVNINKVGDVHRAQDKLDDALLAFEEGLQIRRDLLDFDPDNTEWQRDLFVSLNKVGDVHRVRGDLEKALNAFSEGLDIMRQLLEIAPERTQWRRDLSVSLDKVGNVHRDRGDLEKALVAYEESLEVRRRLINIDPESSQWLRDLSVSLNKVGDIYRARGNLDKSTSCYKEDLRITRGLLRLDPSRASYHYDLSISFYKLALVSEAKENIEEAIEYLESAVSELDPLTKEHGGVASWNKALDICRKNAERLKRKLPDAGSDGNAP